MVILIANHKNLKELQICYNTNNEINNSKNKINNKINKNSKNNKNILKVISSTD